MIPSFFPDSSEMKRRPWTFSTSLTFRDTTLRLQLSIWTGRMWPHRRSIDCKGQSREGVLGRTSGGGSLECLFWLFVFTNLSDAFEPNASHPTPWIEKHADFQGNKKNNLERTQSCQVAHTAILGMTLPFALVSRYRKWENAPTPTDAKSLKVMTL